MKKSKFAMRSVVAFLCAISISMQAVAAEGNGATAPSAAPIAPTAPAPATQAPAASAPAPVTPAPTPGDLSLARFTATNQECQNIIDQMQLPQNLKLEEIARLLAEKEHLENKIDGLVLDQNSLMRLAVTKAVRLQEKLRSDLASGNNAAALTYVRPIVQNTSNLFRQAVALSKQLAATSVESEGYTELREKYIAASEAFGEIYGTYLTVMSTLISVASNKPTALYLQIGSEGQGPAPATPNVTVVYDLTTEAAINSAKSILRILDSETNVQWLTARVRDLPEAQVPSSPSIKYLFRHNPYALIGKLKNDVQDQGKLSKTYNWIMYGVARAILKTTDIKWFSPNVRQALIAMLGVAYDSMMIDRYLNKIQAVIEMSRVVKNGQVVRLSNDQVLDMQIDTLLEYNSRADANDLLLTFARIDALSDSWAQILSRVAIKANAMKATDKQDANKYFDLLTKLQAAQTAAKTMDSLPYLDDPATAQHLRLLITQLAWLNASGYVVVHHAQIMTFISTHWNAFMTLLGSLHH